MARSTAALVEKDILKWARWTAGYSVEEAAHKLDIKPEKVTAWDEGVESPSMSQIRKMASVRCMANGPSCQTSTAQRNRKPGAMDRPSAPIKRFRIAQPCTE